MFYSSGIMSRRAILSWGAQAIGSAWRERAGDCGGLAFVVAVVSKISSVFVKSGQLDMIVVESYTI